MARRYNAVKKRLVKAGLRRATMENGACRVRHAHYLKLFGFTYCPWCSEELIIRHHCDHCDRDFTSTEAYEMHRSQLDFFKANPCPSQEAGPHPSRWLKNRKMFFCPTCQHEYAPKEAEQEIIPVDARPREQLVGRE